MARLAVVLWCVLLGISAGVLIEGIAGLSLILNYELLTWFVCLGVCLECKGAN